VPSIVVPAPCRTVAALQAAAASRSASGLVVAGDEHGRRLDSSQRPDRLAETLVNGGEVASADHHVRLGGHRDQLGRLIEVPVQVAEGEQLHAPNLAGRACRCRGATIFRRQKASKK